MKYNIIYADCPWSYRDKASAGNRGASYKYPTMTAQDIINLPIQKISADRSVLLLWITMPHLPLGLEVMKSWGFKFKTNAFTWVKQNKKADTFFMGGGSYTRANPELCLLGTRGKSLPRNSRSIRQLVVSHLEEHSKKPYEVREKIVNLFGDIPRIELFARELIPGWTCIGKDINNEDIRESLNKIIIQL